MSVPVFDIELRPHIGQYHDSRFGTRTIEHPQWILLYHDAEMERARGVYWTQIGYVGHSTDSIEFLPLAHGLGPETISAVCNRVSEQTGRQRTPHLPAKPEASFRYRAVKELDSDD